MFITGVIGKLVATLVTTPWYQFILSYDFLTSQASLQMHFKRLYSVFLCIMLQVGLDVLSSMLFFLHTTVKFRLSGKDQKITNIFMIVHEILTMLWLDPVTTQSWSFTRSFLRRLMQQVCTRAFPCMLNHRKHEL